MKKTKSEAWYLAMRTKKERGTNLNGYSKAKQLGLPKPEISEESHLKRSKSNQRPHTEDTKKKISEARIKFLHENPDMVPYKLNHYSKGRSYAEEYWKVILDSNNLIFQEQHQIGPYQLDFAFIELKIDLEIDGDQHYLDKRIVESDKRRNLYLGQLGWTIIRVKWSEYKRLTNKKEYVNMILGQIRGPVV
jgi:very-short-patch-repair endonuclease